MPLMKDSLKILLMLKNFRIYLRKPFNYLLLDLPGSSRLVHPAIRARFDFPHFEAFSYILFSNALPDSTWRYITYDINYIQKASRPDVCAHVPQGLSVYYISLYIQGIHNETYKYFDAFFHDH